MAINAWYISLVLWRSQVYLLLKMFSQPPLCQYCDLFVSKVFSKLNSQKCKGHKVPLFISKRFFSHSSLFLKHCFLSQSSSTRLNIMALLKLHCEELYMFSCFRFSREITYLLIKILNMK